jgi:hypothetical protein
LLGRDLAKPASFSDGQAITTVELEANSLEELTYLAGRMPFQQRSQVQ